MTEQQETITLSTDIVEYKPFKVADFFKEKGSDDLLNKIEEVVKNFEHDMSTGVSRQKSKSLAAKISSTKTFLDEQGKKLKQQLEEEIAPTLERIKAIDKERSTIKKQCDALRDAAKKPVLDWEIEEQKRKDALDKKLFDLCNMDSFSPEDHAGHDKISDSIISRIGQVNAIEINESWGSHEEPAKQDKARVLRNLGESLGKQLEYEAQQAELEELRARDAQREAERQKEESERAAKEKADKEAQEKIDAAKKAQLQAEQDAENARQEERDRIEREQLEADKAEAARKADNDHRAKINREARDAMMEKAYYQDLDDESARAISTQILTAIAKGEIPHVTIRY